MSSIDKNKNSEHLGNAAALRETLVYVYNTLEKLRPYSLHINDISVRRAFSSRLCHAKNAIDAALALPPRQCDVGTAEEQTSRLRAICNKYKPSCLGCKHITDLQKENCWLAWAQAPYEAKEGGAAC